MLLMLEDEADRLTRFAAVWRELAGDAPAHFWRDAHAMTREAGPLLPSAAVVSLDHDLEPAPGAADPGDGYLVARWLADQPVRVPVVIHTSNTERGRWMAGAFELAGWRHRSVAPIGDDWIEADWRRAVRRILRRRRA